MANLNQYDFVCWFKHGWMALVINSGERALRCFCLNCSKFQVYKQVYLLKYSIVKEFSYYTVAYLWNINMLNAIYFHEWNLILIGLGVFYFLNWTMNCSVLFSSSSKLRKTLDTLWMNCSEGQGIDLPFTCQSSTFHSLAKKWAEKLIDSCPLLSPFSPFVFFSWLLKLKQR